MSTLSKYVEKETAKPDPQLTLEDFDLDFSRLRRRSILEQLRIQKKDNGR